MKIIWLIVVAALTVLLQISFLPALRPLGIVPNLPLVILLYASFELAASEALALAVGVGLLLDIASGVDFGLRTAFLSFFALLVIIIRRTGADFTRLSMTLTAVVTAGILWDLAILASVVLAHETVSLGEVVRQVLTETAANALLAIGLGWMLKRIFEAIIGRQPVVAVKES